MADSDAASVSYDQHWLAKLQLQFARFDERTLITQRHHTGPLLIQRPFYPEGQQLCHVYLIHPPGGIVGGDRLTLEAGLESGAQVLLTTPGATKCYKANLEAGLENRLRVESGATLEWLPQETILYSGTQSKISTRIELDDNASFIGWEITVLGRPAAREGFLHGWARQSFELWRRHTPLFIERGHWQGGSPLLHQACGFHEFTCHATMVATHVDPAWVKDYSTSVSLPEPASELFAITQLEHCMVARYLGHHAYRAKRLFADVWSALRPRMLQRGACPPRIWQT